MSSIVPVQVYPWPMTEERLDVLKQAKESLGLEVKIMPTKAVPGFHNRVLSFAGKPPWVCDVAMASRPDSVESVAGALRWILTAPEGDNGGYMIVDYLTDVFGNGVVEVKPDPCHCGAEALVKKGSLQEECERCIEAGCELVGWCMFDD